MTDTKIRTYTSEGDRLTVDEREDEHEHEHEREGEREETLVCPECGGQLAVDDEHGETVCTDCGLVVETDRIDHGPEWRSFNDGERTNASRVGAPTTKLLHDKGLSTQIDWKNKDTYGRALSARQRQKMERLRTWDERFRARNHKERNLKQALGEVDRMGSALGLPDDVRETASVIYRRALAEDLLPGRSIEAVATASVYAAARQGGTPRSIPEVAMVSRVDETEFKRAYRYVVRELGLEVQLADPAQYLRRYASELGMDSETELRARELLSDGQETGVHVGKSPTGLAAAALYAAGQLSGEPVTQKEIGEVANVSEVTIRNRYKELLDAASAADAGAAA
jgi:transcription initiation factor TFIIB